MANHKRRIIEYTNGIETAQYESLTECSKRTGIPIALISLHLNYNSPPCFSGCITFGSPVPKGEYNRSEGWHKKRMSARSISRLATGMEDEVYEYIQSQTWGTLWERFAEWYRHQTMYIDSDKIVKYAKEHGICPENAGMPVNATESHSDRVWHKTSISHGESPAIDSSPIPGDSRGIAGETS